MSESKTIDRAALRAVAEKATPGPWRTASNRPLGPWVDRDTTPMAADGQPVLSRNWKEVCLNAAFIAAANPAVVLALLDALDEAEKDMQRLDDFDNCCHAIKLAAVGGLESGMDEIGRVFRWQIDLAGSCRNRPSVRDAIDAKFATPTSILPETGNG